VLYIQVVSPRALRLAAFSRFSAVHHSALVSYIDASGVPAFSRCRATRHEDNYELSQIEVQAF
jgi:hypothetical protein